MRQRDKDLFFAPSLSMAATSEMHSVVKVEPGPATAALFAVSRTLLGGSRRSPFFSLPSAALASLLC
jgi:hypothetical protein